MSLEFDAAWMYPPEGGRLLPPGVAGEQVGGAPGEQRPPVTSLSLVRASAVASVPPSGGPTRKLLPLMWSEFRLVPAVAV